MNQISRLQFCACANPPVLYCCKNEENRCKQPKGMMVIITSFIRVVYALKYPSNVCLGCLDNDPLLLECNYIYSVKIIS